MINQKINTFIQHADSDEIVRQSHLNLLQSSNYLRDTGSKHHFCVYFAGVDLKAKEVFLGHHKKADQWLFNGGHLDADEAPLEAVIREAQEEWDVIVNRENILPFRRLSITTINNTAYQPNCSAHYDLWHFISLDKNIFKPNKQTLASEFIDTEWFTIDEALKIVINDNTKDTLKYLTTKMRNS